MQTAVPSAALRPLAISLSCFKRMPRIEATTEYAVTTQASAKANWPNCAAMLVALFRDLNACRGFLLVFGSALGQHGVGHEHAVASHPACGHRGGAIDQRIGKGIFTHVFNLQRLRLSSNDEIHDFAVSLDRPGYHISRNLQAHIVNFVFHRVEFRHCVVISLALLVSGISQIRQCENNNDRADSKLKLFAFHAFTPSRYPRHYNINTRSAFGPLTPCPPISYPRTILRNMKRYPIFDPSEYLNWKPDASIVAEYEAVLQREPQRARIVSQLNQEQLLGMYAGLLRFRLHDITLRRWVRQGILAKAWLGTGEEAVTVGNVHALNRAIDKVGPMIRNAGACHEMGISVGDMLREYLGTADSPSMGKDLHVGNMLYGVIAPTSQVGALTPVFAGIALTFKKRREPALALTWIGDGATKTTAFHEGMNLAAVLRVPVIFVLQNNQIALGTRLDQHQAGPFTAWSKAYGVKGFSCDGNNVLDTYAATKVAADLVRSGFGPIILSAETFRMGGHATHDEMEARQTFPPEVFEYWGKRDPIGVYESYLELHGISRAILEGTEAQVLDEISSAEREALDSRDRNPPQPSSLSHGLYAGPDEATAEKY